MDPPRNQVVHEFVFLRKNKGLIQTSIVKPPGVESKRVSLNGSGSKAPIRQRIALRSNLSRGIREEDKTQGTVPVMVMNGAPAMAIQVTTGLWKGRPLGQPGMSDHNNRNLACNGRYGD
jgi:hypothetical protein